MHTEMYCENLANLDPVAAIRAIHQAHLQLAAVASNRHEPGELDFNPALEALADCLKHAGHAGQKPSEPMTKSTNGLSEINVRFFALKHDDDGDLGQTEVSEETFLSLGGQIEYERNTVFENGCRQVCLTTDEFVE